MQVQRPHDRRTHIVVIGGGASGVLLTAHLLRESRSDFQITLVEKASSIAHGVAYATTNPHHLLNVRAANMSAFADQPDHFWRWLCVRSERELGNWRLCDSSFYYAPRKIYGDYLASLLTPWLAGSEWHSRLRIVRGECVRVSESCSDVAVTLADGSRHHADFAIIATGHDTPGAGDHSYLDPWTPPAHAGVGADDSVLILGTGLTMIDYTISLLLAGHRGAIVALSRRGLLPRAHRPVQPLAIQPTEVPLGTGMTSLLRWVRHLIDEHAARGGDWRCVIDGLRPFAQQIWQHLSPPARRSFLQHARAWWEVHRNRMAPEIERRIESAISSGQLTVVAAKLDTTEPDGASTLVRYRRRGGAAAEVLRANHVVECRSIGAIPLQAGNSLVRGMLAQGLARLDPLHIGLDVNAECAVIGQTGAVAERLFAVGPVTRATFWEIIAVPDIRNQCAALAGRLARCSASPALV